MVIPPKKSMPSEKKPTPPDPWPTKSQLLGVEGRGKAGSFAPPERDLSTEIAVQIAASRRKLNPALLASSGVTEPRTAPDKPRSVSSAVGAIARKLGKHPTDIRDVARALSRACRDRVAELRDSKPNEKEVLTHYDDLIAFLDSMAAGLAEIADALDQAIKDKENSRIFRGKAAEIAAALQADVGKWYAKNSEKAIDYSFTLAGIGLGYVFLTALGAPGDVLELVTGVVLGRVTKRKKGKVFTER